MKFALVHGTRICQIVNSKHDCFPVSPELSWTAVSDDVTDQDTLIEGRVKKHRPEPLVIKVKTTAERLNELGLNVDDLKSLLK